MLPISEGQQTDDVLFKVRAVDNDSTHDDIGARLIFPIINTPPSVDLNNSQLPPDTLFSVSSFGWTVSDADGLANISRTEVAINDTVSGWKEIPLEEGNDQVFISIDVNNKTEGIKSGDVYLGRTYFPTEITLDGIEVGGDNIFYVRTIDQAGSVSNIDTVSWFIKKQTSKVLFLNDVSGLNSSSSQRFHLEQLQANGINPDIWIINDGSAGANKEPLSDAFPSTTDPTLTKTLAQWDHIYWVSNGINRNINFAQEIASEFIDNGGNFFINIPISDGDITNSDPILDFLSVDSIAVRSGLIVDYEIESGTTLERTDQTYPELITSRTISGTLPLKHSNGARLLYTADFKEDNLPGRPDTDYTGFESVAIQNAEQNIVYFGLDIQGLNGNNNVAEIIDRFCIQLLGFEQ